MSQNIQEKLLKHTLTPFMELRLIDGKTTIFIDNKEFMQCMYLLISIPKTEIEESKGYVNIDELSNHYSKEMEYKHDIITPQEEFIGHCSNLEAWIENDYNPNLLHSNLAIPLLKKLVLKDPRILYSLLYHLDSMFSEYKTVQRKQFLVENYRKLLTKAIEYYNIDNYDIESSLFLRTIMFDKAIRKIFDNFTILLVKREKCGCCEERKDPKTIEFYDYELFYSSYDEEGEIYHVCAECSDHGFPSEWDYFYCERCGRDIHYDSEVWHESFDRPICERCYLQTLESDGFECSAELDISKYYIDKHGCEEMGYRFYFQFETFKEYDRRFDILEDTYYILAIKNGDLIDMYIKNKR